MELTDEGRRVLAIVRRVLAARTNWVLVGDGLMKEIDAEVKKAEVAGTSMRTTDRG